jgi:nucleotide-binding universal stress UspA family protein
MTKPDVRRILFPTDFSACAEGAFRHAAWLADRFGAELHVLHVVEDEAPERAWPDTTGTGALQISVADVCEDLRLPPPAPEATFDVGVVEAEVAGHDVPGAVLDYAVDEEADLVVMGTHGRHGWRRGALGSVAEAVARRAPCPVLTVRALGDVGEWPPRRVLAAVDADALDGGAVPPSVQWAAGFARAYHAGLELLHVAPPPHLTPSGPAEAARARRRARQALRALAEALRDGGAAPERVHVVARTGDPADLIAAAAGEAGVHLVAVGTHGRRGIGRVLLGSVAEAVVRTAPCPVLVVPDRLAEAERAPTARASAARAARRSGTGQTALP